MRAKKIIAAALSVMLIAGLSGCGEAKADTPLVKVGEQELTRGMLDEYMDLNAYIAGYSMDSITDKDTKNYIETMMLEQMVAEELTKQYVTGKDGYKPEADYDKNVKKFLDSVHETENDSMKKLSISDETLTRFYDSQIYGQALYTEVRESIDDLEAKKLEYYNSHQEGFNSGLRLTASHILVEDEKEAQEIKAQLDKGADFAALAKEKSIDPGSGANGGELGEFKEGDMVGEFWNGAKALQVGEVSEPVKSSFGYHIIKLTDRKEAGISPYEEVADQVEQSVIGQAYQARLEELKKQISVEYLDKSLDPAAEKKDSGDKKKSE